MRQGNPDGGLYSEGFSAPFAGYSDGFLVVEDAFDTSIPLAQAVYHDVAVFIGRHTELKDVPAPAALARTVALQGEAFVQGRMPGGLANIGSQLTSVSLAYVRELGGWRRQFADALVYGQLVQVPRLTMEGEPTAGTCNFVPGDSSTGQVASIDTETGVSIGPPQGLFQPLDTLSLTAPTKDSGSVTWDEPAATAVLWRTTVGQHYLAIAALDTQETRTVGVEVRLPPGVLPSSSVLIRRFRQDGTVTQAATVVPVDAETLMFQVTLPPCTVALLGIEPST